MQTDHYELMLFVLEASEELSISRRIKVLRGLSALCGDPQDQANLTSVIDQLKNSDKLCREFNFSFVQKHKEENVKTRPNNGSR